MFYVYNKNLKLYTREFLTQQVFMDYSKIIDKTSYIIAFVSLFLSFILFFSDTFQITNSLSAAILLAALVWISYIMIRCIYLALKK
jgi:hypothetical protein